ncbi:zinc finger domain-containing protein [Streptomyces salyersiae]|uniref:Cell surface glycoprotein n=1 Tax=Streptomyces salyersiae TaxID=3075530 RepID=A0ABU2RVB1_9ACTN|nr:cell surface glycoprotein [Streptomyces sp. DSM 41770]MDT0432776.1 cell surface glycoprotein [Streptomyces sp. DSM 41770]
MIRHEVAALLAYIDGLDPTRAPLDRPAAEERLTQWCDVLADVAASAPHPEGRHWDASHAAYRHITTSPYPIKPSDVSRPWADFRRDVLSRHFDPVPNVDPDNEAAYRAAIATHRRAIETGQTVATPRALMPAGTRQERDQAAAARLKQFGSYVPRSVVDALASQRPGMTERRRLAVAGQADPFNVPCPWGACRAAKGQKCQTLGRPRHDFHDARLTAARQNQEQPA